MTKPQIKELKSIDKKLVDGITFELPSLKLTRTKRCEDFILDEIKLSVSGKTSQECLQQFRSVLGLLDTREKKLIAIDDKTKRGINGSQ